MQKQRNHAVDALKGLMILLIILHHGGLLPFLRHGYLGVDVFFVISGYFLMQGFVTKGGSAVAYTRRRLQQVWLPYLFALLLACVLDYKHLTSFSGGQGFLNTYAPMAAFLTLTEELGFVFHTPVILVGGWFLSVLIIGGFLLYGLLEYNERLAVKVILPFSIVLGFTWLFSLSANVENFRTVGAVGLPLLDRHVRQLPYLMRRVKVAVRYLVALEPERAAAVAANWHQRQSVVHAFAAGHVARLRLKHLHAQLRDLGPERRDLRCGIGVHQLAPPWLSLSGPCSLPGCMRV